METFVEGKLGSDFVERGQELREKTESLGYRYKTVDGALVFTKTGKIEAVVNELHPICDNLGLDVDDLDLVERRNDGSIRSTFDDGRIDR